MNNGDCVKLPDGRIGRVRAKAAGKVKVRVRRTTSATHQFVWLPAADLTPAECPKGWMSPTGYRRYLKATLAKLKQRQEK